MKVNKPSAFEMTSYEKLFKNAGISIGLVDKQIMEIPIDKLHPFHNHPFRVVDDESMDELVASIKENGVLVPGICRKRSDGDYEIISGHRRTHASQRAEKASVPMIVMDYTDEEAIETMVDANLQRENLLPSEKARAYRQKYDARKKMKKKGDGLTLDNLGRESGDNYKTIQRYLWLSRLTDGLLDMVDNKKLGFIPGVDISFLNAKEQKCVEQIIKTEKVNISKEMAAQLKEFSKKKELTEDRIREILQVKKIPKIKKFSMDQERLDAYLDKEYSQEELEELILSLLDKWKKERG